MHLKSLTLKGFKSFPDRARLDFGPGVSVVVGPNGSGKSNVTDAVLWALGEQSPLAVRGQSMQDVIFGGGRGVGARSSAEVELVLDNSDGTLALPLSEISILRRLERTGEGEYRLNGARCRLGDVLELLSDTGLGKETHSVISQGRVEEIVTSKPRDRRLLIEEAAGLGKHRKRRRRAQLKLEHTQENLDRALDVEREARTRLRPLKRQAEAAELHERLERQVLEIRFELARTAVGTAQEQLGVAEADVAQARAVRATVEADLEEVSQRRGHAEQALADRVRQREVLAGSVYGARGAAERLGLRVDQARRVGEDLEERLASADLELGMLLQADAGEPGAAESAQPADADRIADLERQLAELEEQHERELAGALEGLELERRRAAEELERRRTGAADAAAAHERVEARTEGARSELRDSERELDGTRRGAARVGAQLAAVNQFLRTHAGPPRPARAVGDAPRSLSEALRVRPGYELALAAALGERLDAALASDLASAQKLLDGAGPDGAAALLAGANGGSRADAEKPAADGLDGPPVAGAEPLAALLSAPPAIAALAGRLLRDAWVVERLEDLPTDFAGTAVTRNGRVWFGAWGEVRQVHEGGSERVLAQHNERERLIAESERAARSEHAAGARAERSRATLLATESARDQAERVLRQSARELAETTEALRRADWLIEQRRSAPEEGPLAVRRAELQGELVAERRQAERAGRERDRRRARIGWLRARHAADSELLPRVERLGAAMGAAAETVAARVAALDERLARDREAGEEMSAELRACATLEADLQIRLRAEGERVTTTEVAAQRVRDVLAENELELSSLAARLELDLASLAVAEPLTDERAEELGERLQRLERRRQQLGPVNPLAQEEYAEALEHIAELEGRRGDLEAALRELQALIRDADRQIEEVFEETFAATARNFDELVGDLFPGGSGRLRLVDEGLSRRAVLGGQAAPAAEELDERSGEDEAGFAEGPPEDLRGVEIELAPAGKSTKRLTLLSGGEKAMTALAFLFAVILARPCPFYILDEVEAALDDQNLSRFLALLRRHGGRAQFIVITHQQRTMEAADWLYGVSMGGDGVSKVLSRRLPAPLGPTGAAAAA